MCMQQKFVLSSWGVCICAGGYSRLQLVVQQLGLTPGLVHLQGRCAARGAFHAPSAHRSAVLITHVACVRRRVASGLQPVAEQLGLAPGLVRPQARCAAGGTFHAYSAQRSADGPSREGGSPENLPGQELDPNRAPPEEVPSGDSGAGKVRVNSMRGLDRCAESVQSP